MKKIGLIVLLILVVIISGCKSDAKKQSVSANENIEKSDLIEAGKEIASSTFIALSGELQEAMKSGGIENALSYCNENALLITDSLAKVHNADIKRTSLKWRNPKNKPNEQETAMLKSFEQKKRNGEMLTPQLVSHDSKSTFYAPIILQDMCKKCHGPKEEIVNYTSIKDLYPEDQAFGFEQGDLRGMWRITFYNE